MRDLSIKRIIFLSIVGFILLFVSNMTNSKEPRELNLYSAYIIRVVDGDTMVADIDLGFEIRLTERLRLKGVDTPETWRPKNEAEAEHGKQATEFVKQLIENKIVYLVTSSSGKYGRAEVILYPTWGDYVKERDLGAILEENGLLKKNNY